MPISATPLFESLLQLHLLGAAQLDEFGATRRRPPWTQKPSFTT